MVKYIYDAWGRFRIEGNSVIGNINPYRYRGYYFDTEAGLYYLKTRYYDPNVGRFISMDDIAYVDPESTVVPFVFLDSDFGRTLTAKLVSSTIINNMNW